MPKDELFAVGMENSVIVGNAVLVGTVVAVVWTAPAATMGVCGV